jgi:hypothetical protein
MAKMAIVHLRTAWGEILNSIWAAELNITFMYQLVWLLQKFKQEDSF